MIPFDFETDLKRQMHELFAKYGYQIPYHKAIGLQFCSAITKSGHIIVTIMKNDLNAAIGQYAHRYFINCRYIAFQ